MYWVNPSNLSEYVPITEPIEKGERGEGRSYGDHHFVVSKLDDPASQPITFTKAPTDEVMVIRCNEQNNLILYHSIESPFLMETSNSYDSNVTYGDLTVMLLIKWQ